MSDSGSGGAPVTQDPSGAEVYEGTARVADGTNDYNNLSYVVETIIARSNIAALVKVVKVTNKPGELREVGRVDVLPLVNQLDGSGKPVKHETVYGLAYFRYAGGKNAVLLDPEEGDVGFAVFADRDGSVVKQTRKQENPGSGRRFDMADGIYVGLCLADAPEQYLRFLKEGIELVDKHKNKVVLKPDGIDIIDKSDNKILMSSSGIDLNP